MWGRPKLDMSDLIDSNVDVFMYLIERIRLSTCKVRRLNLALGSLHHGRHQRGAWALHFARVNKMWCASLGRQGRGRVYFLPPPPPLGTLFSQTCVHSVDRCFYSPRFLILDFRNKNWGAHSGQRCFAWKPGLLYKSSAHVTVFLNLWTKSSHEWSDIAERHSNFQNKLFWYPCAF